MSVIVKGMEMPKKGTFAVIFPPDDEHDYCYIRVIEEKGKSGDYEIIPLPEKHGRLIDGTSLLDQVLEIRDEEAERNGTESIGFILTTMMAAMVTVQDTIVEAEGD